MIGLYKRRKNDTTETALDFAPPTSKTADGLQQVQMTAMQDEIHVLKKQLYEVCLFDHPPHVKCKCKCICVVVCVKCKCICSVFEMQMHMCGSVYDAWCACISVSLLVFKCMFVQLCVCVCCMCLMHLCAPPSSQLQALQSADQVDASGHTQSVPSTSPAVKRSSTITDSVVE